MNHLQQQQHTGAPSRQQNQHQQALKVHPMSNMNNSSQSNGPQGGNGGYTPEQFEVLKRQYAQAQAGGGNRNTGNNNPSSGSNHGSSNNNPNGPYMVLTQVQVPSHLVGQLSKQQLAQLQQQQQQQQQQRGDGSGSKSSGDNRSQQQVLALNQLPPELQQQVLLQQQQMQQQMQQQGQKGNQQDLQTQLQMQLRQQMQQQQQNPQQQRSQQQQGNPRGTMNMADLQEYIKNNGGELNADLMQQLMNQQQQGGNANNNNSSGGHGNDADNTTGDLFNPFNSSSDGNDFSGRNKRLFLETQVQPVQRQENSNNQNNYGDDDLFKFFQAEMGDDDSGHGSGDFNDGSDAFQSYSSILEPTPLFPNPQQGSNSSQAQSRPGPGPVSSSNVQQQQHMNRQGSSQQQQQHQQQRMPKPLQAASGGAPSGPQGGNNNSSSINNNDKISDAEEFSLPSTMVPPTVLASVCKGTSTKRQPPPKKKPASKKAKRFDNPQDVLMKLVEKHGHDLQRIKSEDAGYDTMPSPLQLSSFGTQVVHAVHTSDAEMLGKLLSCGLSPNPCNQFRDSILDLVCKRSNVDIFHCLVEHGADLRVVDGFGRTPLHHCAWASTFCREIAESIVERDPLQLFIEDKRGQTPMEYVRSELMSEWSEFLEEMADKFWPKGGTVARLTRPKDSRPDGTLPDPKNGLGAGLAAMVSSGNVTPEEIAKMDAATKKTYA